MIAIIPARGGSKGLPGKNIKKLVGKPLIAYSIEAALASKYIDKVVVTTDSEEIAQVAKEYGAEVPIMRPEHLATDTASAVDVYIHMVEYLMKQEAIKIDKFMVLLPTAPLRNTEDINNAVELLYEKGKSTVISMTEAEIPASWYNYLSSEGTVVNAGFGKMDIINNRQNNEKYYVPNGAIYILDYELLKKKRTYYDENTIPYIMKRENSVDIDTMLDFQFAEFLILKENKL